jgi:ribose transport system ATP-binding protein
MEPPTSAAHTPPPARLAARGLCKRFGSTAALAGASLELGAGEVHALVGENGAGKSTLVRCLAGALAPDAGAIELDGVPFAPRSPVEARARGVAVLWQELALAPDLSIEDNLLLGRELARVGVVTRTRTRQRAQQALARVGLAAIDPRRRVADFGIATRQRIELARTLVEPARVIALDEPTSSLGPAEAAQLFELVRELARAGTAILYIAHDLDELRRVASRYTVLRDGATVASGALAAATDDALVRAMVGRAVDTLFPRSAAPGALGATRPAERLLALRDVRTSDGTRVDALDVHRGEVVGIAGLIGAGRSELLQALFGLGAHVVGGELSLCGRRGAARPAQRWSDGAGLLSEDRRGAGLMLTGSLAENVALPRLARLARAGVLAGDAALRHARPWLERLDVRARGPDQPVGELSGGNQQKVQLARLLAADCALLVLDEPTRGVDVGARAEIYRWIDALARPTDAATARGVLLVSSSLPELFGLCDRIAVLADGRLLAARPVGELTPERVLAAAAGGAW